MIRSLKFCSSEFAFSLYISQIIQPCMKYCHVWAGVPNCFLDMLVKLQKRVYWTVRPTLAAFPELLAHIRNSVGLFYDLFHNYYFGRCLSELAELVPLPSSRKRSIVVTLLGCMILHSYLFSDVYVNSFFLAQTDSGILCM